LIRGWGVVCGWRGGFVGFDGFFHGGFEAADAVAEAFAEFGEFLGSEDEQGDPEDEEQMRGLEKSFEHVV
jgi:hypothetical protein